MGTIESIDASLGTEEEGATIRVAAPAVTSGVNEDGMAVYTYATELNVLNAQKPRLADYTRTEAMLLVPVEEDTTKPATTTQPADYIMSGDDLDYTVPKTTTTTAAAEEPAGTVATTTAAATTAATTTTATAATTTTTTTVTTTTAATTAATTVSTTTAAAYDREDSDDIEDDIEEDEEEAEEDIEEAEDTEAPEDDIIGGDVTVVQTDDTTTAAAEEAEEEDTEVSEQEPDETTSAEETQDNTSNANNEIFTVNAAGTLITDTALNIVSAAVMAEISDVFDDEAIKAQAIATYTYIKYYNLNNMNAYVAKSTPSQKVIDLVKQVLGKGIYYDGQLIQAVYSASTAGRSASSKNVWGIDYPYLQSIDTRFIDEEYDINYGRQKTFTSDEIKKYVENSTGIILTGDPADWIKIESYTDEIFVGQMSIGGYKTYNNGTRDVNITGRVFRETILDYDIRSACFSIGYSADTDEFTITTYGYGHCVGFSQHGANILATKYGYTYDQIIKFYYQGVTIS